MITNNILEFLEYLRLRGIERGYFMAATIDDHLKHVRIDFIDKSDIVIGHIYATFDSINKTDTPIHFALKLFNEMEESADG